MGIDKGEVSEAHGLMPDCGGPGTWITYKATGLPRKRQQTEMGTDRRQFQAATCRQQSLPGQPYSQGWGPQRRGLQPYPVSAMEVLTEPAAVGEPGDQAILLHHPAEFDDHVLDYVS